MFNDIRKAQAERKAIKKKVADMPPPVLTDAKSVKEHAKKMIELKDTHHDACTFVDWHLDVALRALENYLGAPAKVEAALNEASDQVPLDAKLRERLEEERQRAQEQAEAEERERQKKTGDVEGQQKLEIVGGKGRKPRDDGSTAEPAGPLTVKRVEPEKVE